MYNTEKCFTQVSDFTGFTVYRKKTMGGIRLNLRNIIQTPLLQRVFLDLKLQHYKNGKRKIHEYRRGTLF